MPPPKETLLLVASGRDSSKRIYEEPIWVFGIPKDSQPKLGFFQLSYGFFRRRLSLRWSGLHIPHGFQRWSSSWRRCFYIWWMINSGLSSLNDKGPEEDTHWSPLWQTLPIYFWSTRVAMVCYIKFNFLLVLKRKKLPRRLPTTW
jgi:hypothetical protein